MHGRKWVLTFINSRETFSHPVTAAAELNPQAAVSGDDWLGQLIATETTWVTGENIKSNIWTSQHLQYRQKSVSRALQNFTRSTLHPPKTAPSFHLQQLLVFWNWMSFNIFFPLTQKLTRTHLGVCCSLAALWIQLKLTFKWCLPPVSISDLHMVIPTQVTPVQIHGGEVQNDLNKKIKTHYWDSRGQRSHIAKSQINMMKPINCINMKEPVIFA